MRVWHVNNIASVGPTLTKALSGLGIEAEFFDLPKPLAKWPSLFKVLGLPVRWRYARKLLQRARRDKVDLLHVHFTSSAPLFLFGRVPMVIHAHGTDVRIFWWNWIRHILNFMVIRRAAKVYFSTPDMIPLMARYTDCAEFFPNPMDGDLFTPQKGPRQPNLILLYTPLDHIKGADRAIAAIKILKKKYPQLIFQAIDMGTYSKQARDAGIEMIPRMPRASLPAWLSRGELILGQFRVGAIGLSELEVLAMGRTIACYFSFNHLFKLPPPFIPAESIEDIVVVVDRFMADKKCYDQLEAGARDWVMRFHGPKEMATKLLSDYKEIL